MSGHVVTSQSSTPSLTASGGLLAPSYLNPSLGLSGAGFKSAFSPITQPPIAHLNSIRYTYGAAAAAAAAVASARNMSLMPYPPLLPSLGGGYGYGGLQTAAVAANKAFHYAALCSCCTGKPFAHHHSPSRDKSSGCIGE